MTSTNSPASLLKNLLILSRDPQSWISMLAVLTLLGVGSGVLESADRPTEARAQFSQSANAQSQSITQPEEQVASLDTGKL